MKLIVLVILFCFAASSAFGFDAHITAQCVPGYIVINVTVVDPNPPNFPHPDAYGGYTVVRYALGTCEEPVMLTEYSIDFTDDFEIADNPNSLGTPYIYAIHTVDLLGNLSRRIVDDKGVISTSCSGMPSFKGTVDRISYVGAVVRPCQDSCWLPEWVYGGEIVANYFMVPLGDYVGTGIELSFFGSISDHWEMGINIEVEYIVPTTCGPVSVEEQSWSNIKARYR